MTATNPADLEIRPLTPDLMEDMQTVLRGTWGSTCWCMYPRLTDAEMRNLPGEGLHGPRRREAMTLLAERTQAPGLLAYEEGAPVGWVAVGPRGEYTRIVRSRATPPVDEEPVWVIPCVTVQKAHRGRWIAIALIRAAVDYAAGHGATAVEAYPRAGGDRTGDDNAFFGTEPMFCRAGFEVVREPIPGLPRNWLPRVAMRIRAGQ